MALHPDFPESPHEIIDPSVRWLPADEALRRHRLRETASPTCSQDPRSRSKRGETTATVGLPKQAKHCSIGGSIPLTRWKGQMVR